MQRLLTLVFLLCLAIPAGISISGCTRNPQGNYCNGEGFGLKLTAVATVILQPQTTGISLAYGQTQQLASPQAKTCKGVAASVGTYTYGTTNNQIVDVSPPGIFAPEHGTGTAAAAFPTSRCAIFQIRCRRPMAYPM